MLESNEKFLAPVLIYDDAMDIILQSMTSRRCHWLSSAGSLFDLKLITSLVCRTGWWVSDLVIVAVAVKFVAYVGDLPRPSCQATLPSPYPYFFCIIS